jgi:hypothetical protein
MALCLSGHPGLACTAAGASEDINTTAIYTDFLFRKKNGFRMALMRLYGSRFILDGQLDNFTTNLCGSRSAKTPTASSRPPELAPELARPRQPAADPQLIPLIGDYLSSTVTAITIQVNSSLSAFLIKSQYYISCLTPHISSSRAILVLLLS